jgi:hypothetical protein
MPYSSQATTVARARQTPRSVSVRSWPLGENARAAWGLLTVAALTFALAAIAAASIPTGIVLAGLLLLSGWRLLVPVRFEIGAAGVTHTTLGRTRRIPWSEIASVDRRPNGVFLARDGEYGLWGAPRGLFIPYQGHKSDLLTSFDFYLSGRLE